jgi:type 2 lantibiotic biosynthesis protein LanM
MVVQGRVPFLGARARAAAAGEVLVDTLPGEFSRGDILEIAASAFDVSSASLARALSDCDVPAMASVRNVEVANRVVEALLSIGDTPPLVKLSCAVMGQLASNELASIIQGALDVASASSIEPMVAQAYLLNVIRFEGTAVCADTLAFELNAAASHELISSRDPIEAVEEMLGLVADADYVSYLEEKYPLLKQRLIHRLELAAGSVATTLKRISKHRGEIAHAFATPGAESSDDAWTLTSIESTSGDSHNGASRVTFVRFSNGRTVVYKPRNVHGELNFQRYLAYLESKDDRLGFHKLKVIACDGYGWVEFAEPSDVNLKTELNQYYFRLGALIAALDAISGTDIHFENVVAAGSHPVVIDLETIFQPSEIESIDKGKNRGLLSLDFYHDTPLITAMFDPVFLTGSINGSPLSRAIHSLSDTSTIKVQDDRFVAAPDGNVSHTRHMPSMNGTPVPYDDYVDDVLNGFRRVSKLVSVHRAEMLSGGLSDIFDGTRVRVIFRYTRHYASMVRAVNSAYALQSLRNTEEILSRLWRTVAVCPGLTSVVAAEHFDVWNGDVPYFESDVGTRSTITSQGHLISDVFPKGGWEVAKSRLLAKDQGRLAREADLIEFCLRAKVDDGRRLDLQGGDSLATATEAPRDPVKLLEAIKNRLLLVDGRVLSMDILMHRDHRTSQSKLGNDFYTGTAGICFALAYGDAESKAGRPSSDLRAISEAVLVGGDFESVLETGICHGVGAAIYAAAHLSALWNDRYMQDLGEHLAEHAGRVLYADRHFDLFSGSAGLLRALLALRDRASKGNVDAQIEAVVDHLLAHSTRSGGARAWMSSIPSAGPTTGYAHGVSGIADALLHAGKALELKRAVDAALEAERFIDRCRVSGAGWRECESDESATPHDMWCHGTAGIALFYQSLAWLHPEERTLTTASFAMAEAERVAPFENDSLCHGWLGNLESILNAQAKLSRGSRLPAIDAYLEELAGRPARCGNERQHISMGLFTGLSGIAYQQLRCRAPADYPSVLTFAPPIR